MLIRTLAVPAIEASRDREVYGSHRDLSYLDDPYILADARGYVTGTRVA